MAAWSALSVQLVSTVAKDSSHCCLACTIVGVGMIEQQHASRRVCTCAALENRGSVDMYAVDYQSRVLQDVCLLCASQAAVQWLFAIEMKSFCADSFPISWYLGIKPLLTSLIVFTEQQLLVQQLRPIFASGEANHHSHRHD